MVVIDDEEIVAALSYKANRNWTLPAPQVSLITPNTFGTSNSTGILTGVGETLWVTYRLSNNTTFTNSLHSNYYSYVVGTDRVCGPDSPKNVAVRFGGDFPCLVQPGYSPTTTTTTYNPTTTTTTIPYTTTTTTVCQVCTVPAGFYATELQVLAQKVITGLRPDPTQWRSIDFTSQASQYSINGYLTQESLTATTIVIVIVIVIVIIIVIIIIIIIIVIVIIIININATTITIIIITIITITTIIITTTTIIIIIIMIGTVLNATNQGLTRCCLLASSSTASSCTRSLGWASRPYKGWP
jgi:hypothetical protein